jgi:hypothetical protein
MGFIGSVRLCPLCYQSMGDPTDKIIFMFIQGVSVFTYNREVPGSNIGSDIAYRD